MIRISFATRLAQFAAVALSVTGLTALDVGAQGKVRLNGGTGAECSYSSITVAPNGDLTVTCAGGNTTDPPSCSVSGSSTATANTSFTLSASCSPAATSWAWTMNGAAVTGGATLTTSVATAGNATFTVRGTNANGAGAVSAGFTVNVGAGEQPKGAPECSFSSNPATPIEGEAASITLTCTNSPNMHAWYQSEGTPLGLPTQTPAGTQSVTFPSSGRYAFWLQAGNDLFGGGPVFQGVVNVAAKGGAGCPAVAGVVGPTAGYDTLSNLRFDLKPGQIGTALVTMPLNGVYSSAQVTAVGATQLETPKTTIGEIAVAPCPGQFDNIPAACKIQVYGTTGLNFLIGGTACPVASGKHYVNVKHLTCTPNVSMGISYCTHYVKLNGR